MSGPRIVPKSQLAEMLESNDIEYSVEEWLKVLAHAVFNMEEELRAIRLDHVNLKERITGLEVKCGRVLDGIPADPNKWIPRPPDRELVRPPATRTPDAPTETRRFDHFRPCDHVKYPGLAADEYALIEGAPSELIHAAENKAIVDGWRYWVSTQGRYIYRKQV